MDFFDDAVYDIKKGRSMEEAHRAQLLYYLWHLKRKGVEGLQGGINYPKPQCGNCANTRGGKAGGGVAPAGPGDDTAGDTPGGREANENLSQV
jgi:hypothetical protein